MSTADEVIGLLTAARDDPATGHPDPAAFRAFVTTHPLVARVQQIVAAQQAPVSLARTAYRALHVYRFVNADDDGRWARYHWPPEAGVGGQPAANMATLPHGFLFDKLDVRLTAGPVAFTLELQLAVDDDPVHDVSAFWPDDRRHRQPGPRPAADAVGHPGRIVHQHRVAESRGGPGPG